MRMYFDTAYKVTNILFEGVSSTSVEDIALVSVVSFLLTIVFSGLAALKDVITAKRNMNPLADRSKERSSIDRSMDDNNSQSNLLSSLRIPTNVDVIRRHKFKLFALESLIHTLRLAYGYMLMLVVMTYNVWLTLAVVLGSGVGYFIFNPLTSHLSTMYSQPPMSMHSCQDDDDGTRDRVREGVTMAPPPVNTGQREPLLDSDTTA